MKKTCCLTGWTKKLQENSDNLNLEGKEIKKRIVNELSGGRGAHVTNCIFKKPGVESGKILFIKGSIQL